MASDTDICNRALQKVGAKRIASLTENSPNGRDCNAVYEQLRDSELSAHPWSFARGRAQLPADAEAPAFGYANQFGLPADFLSLSFPMEPPTMDGAGVASGPLRKDWQIEGNRVLTNDSAPLNFVYTRAISDTSLFHPLFTESLASRIALELNEKINQSNTKKVLLQKDYDLAIAMAKKVNAIDRPAQIPPEDTWVTARL